MFVKTHAHARSRCTYYYQPNHPPPPADADTDIDRARRNRIRPPLAVSPAHPDVSAGSYVTIRVRSAPAPADRSQSQSPNPPSPTRAGPDQVSTDKVPSPTAYSRAYVNPQLQLALCRRLVLSPSRRPGVFVRNGNQVATRTGMPSKHPSCVRTYQPPAVAWRGWLAAGRRFVRRVARSVGVVGRGTFGGTRAAAARTVALAMSRSAVGSSMGESDSPAAASPVTTPGRWLADQILGRVQSSQTNKGE